MTVSTPGRTRLCVTIELDPTPPRSGDVVLAAALQCFTAADPVEVAIYLHGVPELGPSHAEAVLARCEAACPDRALMPDVVLLCPGEKPEYPVVLAVSQVGKALPDARAVVLLANLARELWDGARERPASDPVSAAPGGKDRPAPTVRDRALTLRDPALTLRDPALTLRDPALGGIGSAPSGNVPDRSQIAGLLGRLATPPPATPAPLAPPLAQTRPAPALPAPAGFEAPRPTPDTPAIAAEPTRTTTERTLLRQAALEQIATVDEAGRAGRLRAGGLINAVVLVQHLDSWGALHTLTEALRDHPAVRLDVVALDSDLSRYAGETSQTLSEAGFEVRDADWMRAGLSGLDLVVLCDGYDSFRPEGLRIPDLCAAGIRLVYSPYGTNIGGGALQEQRQYNGLLHNVAWRVLAPTRGQKELFAGICEVGDSHVHALGSVKRERVLAVREDSRAGSALRRATGARVNVLWNPHFTVGDDGWSTFLTFVSPMLRYFTTRKDLGLIIRPHFRLLPDLRSIPALAGVERTLRATAAQHRTIVLDESRDYLAAFAASDALLSDQSSLIPEYLPMARPVLYLHRPGDVPVNADSRWVQALPTATTWSEVARFLSAIGARRAPLPPHDVIGPEHLGDGDAGAGARAATMLADHLRAEVGP